jgi:hypothetical protein
MSTGSKNNKKNKNNTAKNNTKKNNAIGQNTNAPAEEAAKEAANNALEKASVAVATGNEAANTYRKPLLLLLLLKQRMPLLKLRKTPRLHLQEAAAATETAVASNRSR